MIRVQVFNFYKIIKLLYLIHKAKKKLKKVENCKIKKFKPIVFDCLPSSGMKMTIRMDAYISYVIPVGKSLEK